MKESLLNVLEETTAKLLDIVYQDCDEEHHSRDYDVMVRTKLTIINDLLSEIREDLATHSFE